MQDLIYLAAMVLFFRVAFAFVAAFGRLVGVGSSRESRPARSTCTTREVGRLNASISNLLDLSRLEARLGTSPRTIRFG